MDRRFLATPALICTGLAAACLALLVNAPVWAAAWAAIFLGLMPAAFARWNHWQSTRAGWGGILIAYPVVYVLAYTVGSVKLGPVSVLGVDPDATQWALYLLGLAAFMAGVALGRKGAVEGVAPWQDKPVGIPAFVGTVGLVLTAVNYATGGIPALLGDINAARFEGNGARLSQLTGVAVGLEQFAVVAIGIDWLQRRRDGRTLPAYSAAVALACLVSLAISASRTFFVLPIVAIGFVILERRRVRIVAVTIVAALVLSGLTWFNLARAEASGTRTDLEGSLERNGLARFPLASGLLSLQVGPRVFQASRDRVPHPIPYQSGDFFLTDGSLLLRTHKGHSSDWFTTTVILGRNYELQGGSPPTVLGGLYLDGGPWLIVVGMLVLGFTTRRMRDLFLRGPTVYTAAAYGYWSAWMLHSIYNYVSLKPMVIAFMLCAVAGAVVTRTAEQEPSPPNQRLGVGRHGG